MSTMQAARRRRYGGPKVVTIDEIDRPTPVDDEVLIRVRAASVNRSDLDGLKPKPWFSRLFMGLLAPRDHGVGLDAAGDVEAIGPGVTRFQPGDELMVDMFAAGRSGGAFAEYVCAPEKAFAPIPLGMSFEDAAALPHSAILAVQGLRKGSRTVRAGDAVLVDGASGNVGPFIVQIAKAMGAEVTGVASGDKLDFVRSLGADHVLDYRQVDYTSAPERYDWIVAVDSHHRLLRVRRALRPDGVYITMGGDTGSIFGAMAVGLLVSRFSDKWSGLLLWWKPMHAPDVATLTELIGAGKIRPAIDRRMPFDQVVDALRYVDEGRASGKVVLTFEA